MLVFNNVSYCYSSKSSGLKNISFSVEKGDLVFITGSSSHYKTTLLNLIYGRILPQEGEIKVLDITLPKERKKIPTLRKKIGYIFSPSIFFENLTVFDNLKIALLIKDFKHKGLEEDRIKEMLSFFPEIKKDTEVFRLSASLKEKLNILRAIASRPPIILADEPFKHFVKDEIRDVMDILLEENKNGTTIVIATSNKEMALSYNKRVIEIKNGRIVDES